MLGLAAGTVALVLAWQHPTGPVPAVLGVLLVCLAARYFWTLWPGWMLGLIPWVGLAPWTGWTLVEEFDLIVLASLAGGYLAMSGPHRHAPPAPVPIWRRELRWRKLTLVLLGLSGLSVAMSVVHGLVDAGGLRLDFYQDYTDAGQALRAGKAFLWLLLLLPLWQRVARRTPQTLAPSIMLGATSALLGVCVGAMLESTQFAGHEPWLSGFFWEMHVGGAALEGALALLLPFGLLAALRSRRGPVVALSVALVLLTTHVVLNTRSHPLWLAIGLSLPLTLTLWLQQDRRRQRGERDPASSWLPGQVFAEAVAPALPPGRSLLVVGLLLALTAWVAVSLWPLGGYRGLAALAGAVVALLAQPVAFARQHRGRALSSGLGLLLVTVPLLGAAGLLAMAVERSAYASFIAFWLLSIWLGRKAAQRRAPWFSGLGDALRAGLWLACVGGVGLILWSYAGLAALEPALLPLALLALVWPLSQGGWYGSHLQQLGWQTRWAAMGSVALVTAMVGVLAHTTGWRLPTTHPMDFAGERLRHWQQTLSAFDAESGWAFGAGAGRFAWVYSANAAPADRVSRYRWQDGSKASLRLTAGQRVEDGELLRMTQRIDAAPPGLSLILKARNDEDVLLLAEVCHKHILSRGACHSQRITLRANPDGWREHRIHLGGQGELDRRPLQFALALAKAKDSALITDLSLKGRDGVELLRNGDFRQGLRHWLSSSEKWHTPWHTQHIGLHLLFEQGLFGLAIGVSLWLLAMGRLLIGSARDHPLAPAVASGLVGFLIVGQFESLIDVPRLALLFFVLTALGLGLRAPPPPPIPKSNPTP